MYFKVYQDTRGEWRWRLRAENGAIIADSAEGYQNTSDLAHAIGLVMATNGDTPIK